MNPHPTHTVSVTPEGRFAVVDPQGETLAVVCDESLAIQCAAALDSEPVRTVAVEGRWKEKAA